MSDLSCFYSGTSGLLLPVRNKLFYPDEFKSKSRLCFYASLMNSIEVNSSFYKIPMASTIARWAEDVPERFRFTFKLFREITHNKGLLFDAELVQRFMDVISHAGEKKGCVLVQFPPSVRIEHLRQLARLVTELRHCDEEMNWNIALEFRHVSLYRDEVYRLLEDNFMALVIQDMPASATPMLDSDLPFVYLRFHGPGGSYRGSYDEQLLYEYAGYISDWLAEGKTVYVYFNNTMGDALKNLNTLKDVVHGSR
ncbi:DUF72 domain-containing protein [Pedobacter faecalis]|uniref:DUF72 domain-containing protein n=1 Tax=Pedobacter faecalis TaxID=3041495 RepID=UPI00254D733F|nr:DUF72 domain-containing protein [Pedobacter sp. ELA7]